MAKVTPPRVAGSAADAPYLTRERMYINEWTVSRNPPAATAYGDDFAVVWRTNEMLPDPIARNRAEMNLLASGEFSEGPADR